MGAYGDSSLWYLIAEANGLSGNSDLRVGQTLSIPNRVTAQSNNASTFKPYDPSRVVGDTSPNLPQPPASGGGGCGGLGQILMVVVAVVVAVYAPQMLANSIPGLFAGAGEVGIGVAGYAAGAAAGSIASQLVGNAIGAVDGFNWQSVAMAAISAGATAGLGGGDLLGTTTGTLSNAMVRAAVSNAMSQGIGVVVGLQPSFDWRSVAASAIGAGVGFGVSEGLGLTSNGQLTNNFSGFDKFSRAALTGFAAGATTAMARGGTVSIQQVASDAFGNALGNSIADALRPQNSAQQRFRQDEIRAQNAQGQSDRSAALYGLDIGTTDMGLRLGSGAGLSYAGLRASDSGAFGNTASTGLPVDMSASAANDTLASLGLSAGNGNWGGAEPMVLAAGAGFKPERGASQVTTGSALLDEGLQRMTGTLLGGASLIHGGAKFVRDQALGLANVLTGGELAKSSSTVNEAVQSNAALGQAILDLPGQVSRYSLQALTGNRNVVDDIKNALHVDEINTLNANGDYLGAQVLTTQGALNVAGFAVAGGGVVRASAGFAGAARMGGQLAAEDFGASSVGQRVGAQLDQVNYQLGNVSYVVAPQQRVMGWADAIPETSPYVTPYDPRFPWRPDPAYSIDTSQFSSGTPTSGAGGGLRNSSAYWKAWAEQVPGSLSPSNLRDAQNGTAPTINQDWVNIFPQHAEYMGDSLLHHHSNFGQYAIPVPSSTHIGPSGPWHLEGIK